MLQTSSCLAMTFSSSLYHRVLNRVLEELGIDDSHHIIQSTNEAAADGSLQLRISAQDVCAVGPFKRPSQ
jgi:hypothetical protein